MMIQTRTADTPAIACEFPGQSHSAIVSEDDAAQFFKLYKSRPSLFPSGVDLDKFNRIIHLEVRAVRAKYGLAGQTVISMGLYEYTPNKGAIDILLKEVFPLILNTESKVRLAIIGGKIGNAYPLIGRAI
jgi:hypothetical protein